MAPVLDFQPRSEAAADALGRFERVAGDFVAYLGALGALVTINVEDLGRAVFTAGHSDVTRSRAVHPTDAYQIGSQSKTFTAVTLALLARDRVVDLDRSILDYLDLPVDRRITLRHCLMNTCGLGEYTSVLGDGFDRRLVLAPRNLIGLALPQGQLFEPGERFDYCNTGWVIAALAIEAVTRKSYATVVEDRILQPLGLKASAFGGRLPEGEVMRGYVTLPAKAEPVDMTAGLSWAFGAGDGVASAPDVLKFYLSLLRDDSPLGVSLQDLTADTAKPSSQPHFAMSLGAEYGLGLERRAWAGREVWGHPGSTYSTRSSTWIDPQVRVGITTCITMDYKPGLAGDDIRYPRAQLFAMALDTAYALAAERT